MTVYLNDIVHNHIIANDVSAYNDGQFFYLRDDFEKLVMIQLKNIELFGGWNRDILEVRVGPAFHRYVKVPIADDRYFTIKCQNNFEKKQLLKAIFYLK